MPNPERQTTAQLKDDLSRTLRSSSPAIKRPASDMGAQEREDHTTDVEMEDNPDVGVSPNSTQTDNTLKTQNAGKRQRNTDSTDGLPHTSDPKSVAQTIASEDSTSTLEPSLPRSGSSSTTATSTSGVPTSDLPSIDEQVRRVTELLDPLPHDGQKGYVVSIKWLRRVQARGSDFRSTAGVIEKAATEGEVGPLDNSDIAIVGEDSGNLTDEQGEPFVSIRPGLQLGEDCQIFPQQAWDLVIQWYGIARTSPVITRYAHSVNEDDPMAVQWELYPPVWTFLKVPAGATTRTQREKDMPPPRMLNSRHTPFMKWLKQAKELVGIDMTTKVRVWRILGGLKSTSASGILTPAASRSASPAPGAEIVATAGDRMLLDVNTFVLLQQGEQRQLIEHKDHTADEHYNGKVDLSTFGLGKSDVIVLEEQATKTDEWPSENLKLTIGKNLKAKNLNVSGRSSPTPSMMTRGRTQRDGRPKGIVGLTNLGNTCYMNSALQCIRSVQELTQYFLSGYFKKELNVGNPLGHHGEVAKAYGSFIENVYHSASSFAPSAFKKTIGKYGTNFSGYGQQDSQEFLLFLLDGLQEDLNRIHKKPYIEKPDSTDEMVHDENLLKQFADKNWSDYKARNDSVITDLFAGMYKSTLTCPVCDKVSIIFDPFNNLTLQLPIENNWSKEVFYFPLHTRPIRIDIDIDKNSNVKALKEFISLRTKYDPNKMMCAESYKSRFFKMFDNNDTISELNINANDVLCVYELDEKPTNYNADKRKKFSSSLYGNKNDDAKVDADSPQADQLLVPVYHRLVKTAGLNRTSRQFFGHASYVVLSRRERKSYDLLLKKMLGNVVGMTTLNILDEKTNTGNDDATPEDSDTLLVGDDGSSSGSINARASSVQGEDGMIDVSMRDASQVSETASRKLPIHVLLESETPVPQQLQKLFDMRIFHSDEGIPTGWNSILDNQEYESLKSKAAITSKQMAHRPARPSSTLEDTDSSADELADIEYHQPITAGSDTASESGHSAVQVSDEESVELPETRDIISGKDSRGANNRTKKKTYSRKGKKIVGKPSRRTPPPLLQPRVNAVDRQELIVPGDAIILDWSSDSYDALFAGASDDDDHMRGTLTHDEMELYVDEELQAKRLNRSSRRKNGVTLQDCLKEFGKTETLSEQNAWYCPRCKEHRRATKQFELWKVPDILVMHLKRFSSNRNFRDKLELKVEYPLEGLDMRDMVRDKSEGTSLIYDLVAVDNHYGGLGGGHYTAYARNFDNNNWYDYNDSHVSQVKDPERSVVTPAAYLLFYRRRTEHPLGGPTLESVLTGEDPENQDESRESSPSGEGRRLGDYSHFNGSSSASQVDRARHVGDGGSVTQGPLMINRGPILDLEGESLLRGTSNRSTPPPPYAEEDKMLLDVDEGIDIGPHLPWDDKPSWDWSGQSQSMAVPPSSNVDDEDLFTGPRRNSNESVNVSSTGGAGGSPRGSLDFGDHDMDMAELDFGSDADRHEVAGRNVRESAPAPDIPQVRAVETPNDDDDDDEESIPVVEIHVPDEEE